MSGQDVLSNTGYDTETMVSVELTGKIQNINLEDYIIGIMAKEIPEEYSVEAMKTQAVIIRTRLLRESENEENYKFQDSFYTYEDMIKKWVNHDPTEVYNNMKEAVYGTQGEVVLVGDALVITPYHLQNKGETRSGVDGLGEEYSHLQSVECTLDVNGVNANKKYTVKYADIQDKLEIEEELDFQKINIHETTTDGYVSELEIAGNIISGEQFREMFQLNSTAISLQESTEIQVQITTRGSGHGIGLSQNTANYMALEGKTYIEILKYFYTGVEIKKYEEINETIIIEEKTNEEI